MKAQHDYRREFKRPASLLAVFATCLALLHPASAMAETVAEYIHGLLKGARGDCPEAQLIGTRRN